MTTTVKASIVTPAASSPALAWLDVELDRIWLLGEICLRQLQESALRPKAHAALLDLEAILASRRAARRGPGEGAAGAGADLAELRQALAACQARVAEARRRAPIARVAVTLALRPLELEVLLIAMAPHIDPALGHLFALLRGETARRGVDLALVALLHCLGERDRDV